LKTIEALQLDCENPWDNIEKLVQSRENLVVCNRKPEKGGTKASNPSTRIFPHIFHPETLHPETLLAHTFHRYTFHPETLPQQHLVEVHFNHKNLNQGLETPKP
jgi:hypothetical protein